LAASLTRDPLLIAGVAFVKQLAWILLSLHAGALIDRLDRRLLMGYVDFFRTALIGSFGSIKRWRNHIRRVVKSALCTTAPVR